MPTYMMSLFPIPDGVIERLDVLRRKFLWEGNSETKKFHLVKWDALIGSKQKGGMEVRNLKTQNQCLMMKWLWRFASSELALWKEVVQLKYEMANHWTTKMVTDTYGINLWRSIRNLWPKLRENCSIRTEDVRKVLSKIVSVAFKYHFRMPPYFTLLLRSLASLEGQGGSSFGGGQDAGSEIEMVQTCVEERHVCLSVEVLEVGYGCFQERKRVLSCPSFAKAPG
ncbi:hypothetical protein MTR67_018996 [Solanum verrucosum]|uniref:Uncharacterized protein n=1 Tax=Solanum verrucosum TaxID=315347 RepID=A0AAF0TMW5_SOLVR|nr:hypothetical protein MTR67_018996 [Solanum verrucosum]